MPRTRNPFTARQISLLVAIREKIMEINCPEKDYISHESVDFYIEQTKIFGMIPKLAFKPNTQSIKAEIMRNAGLTESVSENRKERLASIRRAHGFRPKRKPKNDRERLADLFDKEWNNIALKAKKATFTAAYINHLFAGQNQQIAEPIKLLQQIIRDEYADQIKPHRQPINGNPDIKTPETRESKRYKGYDTVLEELEQSTDLR